MLEGVLNFNCTLIVFWCNILVIFKNLERCPGCENLAVIHSTIKVFSSPLKARQKHLLPFPLFWPFFLFNEVGFFSFLCIPLAVMCEGRKGSGTGCDFIVELV